MEEGNRRNRRQVFEFREQEARKRATHPPRSSIQEGADQFPGIRCSSTFETAVNSSVVDPAPKRKTKRGSVVSPCSRLSFRPALSVLSGLSVADLAQSIALQDSGRLTRIPGIGKKTAERLLLELRGKLADVTAPAQERPSDVLNALLALGYSDKEAQAAIRGIQPGMPVAEGIRAALKALAK